MFPDLPDECIELLAVLESKHGVCRADGLSPTMNDAALTCFRHNLVSYRGRLVMMNRFGQALLAEHRLRSRHAGFQETADGQICPSRADAATHSSDFTSVDWYGARYTFDDGHQAKAIGLLWTEYETGGHGLSENTIGEKIGSASNNYRLSHTFRDHPAFGTMIQKMQAGVYCLRKPESRQNPA